MTLGLPLIARDGLGARLKSVAERREELRAKHHASLNAKRGMLRVEPSNMMKSVLERFKLGNMLESKNSKEKLASAGFRGQAPLIAFMFFRFVMPPVVLLVMLFYLFVVTHFHYSTMEKVTAAFAGALLGYYLPDLWVSNATSRRQQSIMRAFPDALDLMLICVESGMSDRNRLSARCRRDRDPVRRTGRGAGAHHRRTVLFARPPPGLRQSGQALRPCRRQIRGRRPEPG